MDTPERNTVFLSSLNALIDDVNQLVRKYKQAQLTFAHHIYSSGNAHVFDLNGKLQNYQHELKIIVDKLELQLADLNEVRNDLNNTTRKQ